MDARDTAAALERIKRHPDQYPIIRDLPDQWRAVLEPAERLGRYHDIAALLLADLESVATAGSEAAYTPIQIRNIAHAAKMAIRALECERADMQRALSVSIVKRHELMARIEALECEREGSAA